MDSTFQKLAEANGILNAKYRERVGELMRARYTQSDELALLRQREQKPEEFAQYDAFAEACKRQAKEELGIT